VGFNSSEQGMVVPLSVTSGGVTPGSAQIVPGSFLLEGVACPAAATCVAVGFDSSGQGAVVPLTVTSGGVTPGSAQAVAGTAGLSGVACPGATACLAVGSSSLGGVVVPISFTSGGVTLGSAQAVAGTAGLSGVACPGATACLAVGESPSSEGVVVPLSVTSGGATLGSAQAVLGILALDGAACASTTICEAVGSSPSGQGGFVPLSVTSGGVTPGSAQAVGESDVAFGAACPSATSCMAVGEDPSSEGVVSTIPAVVSLYTIAAEGTDGQLWVQTPELASGWQPLGGQIIAAPAVAEVPQTSGPASPLFVATGTDHSLWIRSLNDAWTTLTPGLFTYCLDNPGAVVTGPASSPLLTVACEGGDHSLYAATVAVPSSGLPAVVSWTSLGGSLGAGPAVAPVNGVITYFVTASFNDGQVWTTTNGTDWGATPWSCLGHPAAGIAQGGTTTFFGCQGLDGQLWAGPLDNVTALGGAITPGPALGITSAGAFFFAEANFGGGSVWFRTTLPNWANLGGSVLNGVAAVGLD
jgi:hypothetical protein